MAAKSTLVSRVITILVGIGIPFTFPLHGDDLPDAAIERGTQLVRAGKYDQAENALRSALKRLEDGSSIGFFTATSNLGATFYYRGRFTEAESTFRRAVEVWRGIPA